MEDENGLELSLGLGFGGSSSKSKGKSESSLDIRIEDEKGNKPKNDLNVLLSSSSQKQESSSGSHSQRNDSIKPQENFFLDLTSRNADADASISLGARGLWAGSSNNRSTEIEEEKRSEGIVNKRKLDFEDISAQKKPERDANRVDFHDKRTSHVSLTEEGSTAENEVVADSEVEGSTSRFLDEGSKQRFVGVGGPDAPKEFQRFPDVSTTELHGQRRPIGLPENESKHGMNFGVPFSVQPANIMSMSYQYPTKDSNPVGASMTPVVSTSNGDQRMAVHATNSGSSSIAFGYSPVQLPTLDKDNSWGLISQHQHFHPPATLDNKHHEGLRISKAMQIIGRNPSEAAQYDARVFDRPKGDGGKQHGVDQEGSSSQAEDEGKGSSKPNRRAAPEDGLSHDFSAIKPGISPEVKIGGCGSYPNLPWVSTKAPGPNGRTISGVTYRFSSSQIRIVCACHGTHMSPEEFIRHASDENVSTGDGNNGGLASAFPGTNNPSASAHS
ncbi:unnamed protein product [Linum tenue]|uniref:Ninja-family protein n=1 Tax=Linum tenue TaxID=586396 RepID=A0AAV0HZP4_9ROSI|nr:unnamed protein product [Linum tenue]